MRSKIIGETTHNFIFGEIVQELEWSTIKTSYYRVDASISAPNAIGTISYRNLLPLSLRNVYILVGKWLPRLESQLKKADNKVKLERN